ncbi:MAG: hypothetical protein V6Z82_01755 [Flavobacteriales bacterium]
MENEMGGKVLHFMEVQQFEDGDSLKLIANQLSEPLAPAQSYKVIIEKAITQPQILAEDFVFEFTTDEAVKDWLEKSKEATTEAKEAAERSKEPKESVSESQKHAEKAVEKAAVSKGAAEQIPKAADPPKVTERASVVPKPQTYDEKAAAKDDGYVKEAEAYRNVAESYLAAAEAWQEVAEKAKKARDDKSITESVVALKTAEEAAKSRSEDAEKTPKLINKAKDPDFEAISQNAARSARAAADQASKAAGKVKASEQAQESARLARAAADKAQAAATAAEKIADDMNLMDRIEKLNKTLETILFYRAFPTTPEQLSSIGSTTLGRLTYLRTALHFAPLPVGGRDWKYIQMTKSESATLYDLAGKYNQKWDTYKEKYDRDITQYKPNELSLEQVQLWNAFVIPYNEFLEWCDRHDIYLNEWADDGVKEADDYVKLMPEVLVGFSVAQMPVPITAREKIAGEKTIPIMVEAWSIGGGVPKDNKPVLVDLSNDFNKRVQTLALPPGSQYLRFDVKIPVKPGAYGFNLTHLRHGSNKNPMRVEIPDVRKDLPLHLKVLVYDKPEVHFLKASKKNLSAIVQPGEVNLELETKNTKEYPFNSNGLTAPPVAVDVVCTSDNGQTQTVATVTFPWGGTYRQRAKVAIPAFGDDKTRKYTFKLKKHNAADTGFEITTPSEFTIYSRRQIADEGFKFGVRMNRMIANQIRQEFTKEEQAFQDAYYLECARWLADGSGKPEYIKYTVLREMRTDLTHYLLSLEHRIWEEEHKLSKQKSQEKLASWIFMGVKAVEIAAYSMTPEGGFVVMEKLLEEGGTLAAKYGSGDSKSVTMAKSTLKLTQQPPKVTVFVDMAKIGYAIYAMGQEDKIQRRLERLYREREIVKLKIKRFNDLGDNPGIRDQIIAYEEATTRYDKQHDRLVYVIDRPFSADRIDYEQKHGRGQVIQVYHSKRMVYYYALTKYKRDQSGLDARIYPAKYFSCDLEDGTIIDRRTGKTVDSVYDIYGDIYSDSKYEDLLSHAEVIDFLHGLDGSGDSNNASGNPDIYTYLDGKLKL